MNQAVTWLRQGTNTLWSGLAEATTSDLPVPNGFIVFSDTSERSIRDAYDEMKIREKTHFVAVRGPSHTVLNVHAADQILHAVRRFRSENPHSPLLIQRMIHSSWCGKARHQDGTLMITANEGVMVLDPDTYICNITDGICIRQQIQSVQRRMIRHVNGDLKTIETKDIRTGMSADQLKLVMELAQRAQADVTWALDDQDRPWLISKTRPGG